ncbi:SigE family RNA polymerase sigma factor [Actinobacteria bacterium YIM 96077]|uniref:SigE family RNA polymerase sigma factor n=1 Tax=Phytoactinopolyspora halophila TaxID=1981511 RepID=A0A329QKF0_9ACTN|nr:SigE family RNA polymerase sigma factor [Phytoactinopolyspora halophila]AYY14081.1 SigE family RNA polymerase sigma factor [Actinobacteria bacterium YIM 96077]RAW10988.1 SigE family RNA polymerase sigma factor [Phytoactinopolyspora halophila]
MEDSDRSGGSAPDTDEAPVPDADTAITQLYAVHYAGLVRLAALLLRDESVAEEVVQDAFVALHRRWRRLRDPAKALSYLRTSVVRGTRSVQRRKQVARRSPHELPPDAPSAEHSAMAGAAGNAVVEALRELPARQREALVLRYYGGLSESEIATAMKISNGAVKSHTSRGLAALRPVLEPWS